MILDTPRLRLREFRRDDREAVQAYAGDAEVTRHTDWGPNEVRDTEAFLDEVAGAAGERPRDRFGLAVVRRDADVPIGAVELRVVSAAHRRGEIGYVVTRSWWGHGYATEAAGALLRFGFDELGLHKVSATCRPENVASARVLAKLGMLPEGYLREQLLIRGRWRDSLLFAALAVRAAPGSGGVAG